MRRKEIRSRRNKKFYEPSSNNLFGGPKEELANKYSSSKLRILCECYKKEEEKKEKERWEGEVDCD